MEQDQEVKDLDRAEVKVEAVLAGAKEEDSLQDQVLIACAQAVVKEQLINWGGPVINNYILNVELP